MSQIDFIGGQEPPPPFRDIRNVRPALADEKATLLLQLGRLINRIPPRINSGSIQDVRSWREDRTAAAKVAGNSRSSKQAVSSAINRMQKWWTA